MMYALKICKVTNHDGKCGSCHKRISGRMPKLLFDGGRCKWIFFVCPKCAKQYYVNNKTDWEVLEKYLLDIKTNYKDVEVLEEL